MASLSHDFQRSDRSSISSAKVPTVQCFGVIDRVDFGSLARSDLGSAGCKTRRQQDREADVRLPGCPPAQAASSNPQLAKAGNAPEQISGLAALLPGTPFPQQWRPTKKSTARQ